MLTNSAHHALSTGLFATFFAMTVAAEPMENDTSPLGTNLAELEDYSPEQAFIDVFKQSRSWVSATATEWADGRPVDVDENGWVRSLLPEQRARTLMFWHEQIDYPVGDYIVLYDGDGDIDYDDTGRVVSREPGREVLRVEEAKHGILLAITRTDPSDPLRNIRVLAPGGVCDDDPFSACRSDADCAAGCLPFEEVYEEQIYHPAFLSRLRPYASLRFLNWMRANDSTHRGWGDRPKLEDARWTEHGVPVEAMVHLVNLLGADPWFTIPHLVDDDYVRRFAAYVRDHLEGQRVYVEHSNEVWNSMFEQSKDAQQRGLEAGLAENPFEAQMRHHAGRSREIFEIWREVFGSSDGLVRVMGAHAANAWVSEVVLAHDDAHLVTDAVAIAPYFGTSVGYPEKPVDRWSVDDLMEELAGPALDEVDEMLEAQAAVASTFGVELVAYEGGQHLAAPHPAADDPAVNALLDAANRDPRMKDVYLDYLSRWKAHGGRLFAHYYHCGAMSKWGRWGALENLTQPLSEAPKHAALMQFIEENPRWW